jgi:hypothetical protein
LSSYFIDNICTEESLRLGKLDGLSDGLEVGCFDGMSEVEVKGSLLGKLDGLSYENEIIS